MFGYGHVNIDAAGYMNHIGSLCELSNFHNFTNLHYNFGVFFSGLRVIIYMHRESGREMKEFEQKAIYSVLMTQTMMQKP